MRFVVAMCLAAALLTPNAWALDDQQKAQAIKLYNLTVDLYSLVVGLIDDLAGGRISDELAEQKLSEWQERYGQKTESVPSEAQRMCALMSELLDLTGEMVDDYEPMNIRTKDRLKEIDKLKSELKSAMTELRYALK